MKLVASVLAAMALATLPVHAQVHAQVHPQAQAGGGHRAPEVLEGRYIVVYERSVERPAAATRGLERAHGFEARLTYGSAIRGFAARLTTAQVGALERDPEVALVAADRPVHTSDVSSIAEGDAAPTGVRRIRAATSAVTRGPSSVNVAVLDTGVDLAHPDLNATHGTNCRGTGPATDDNGHGTHVAGTIGARNDGAGLIGVAPGTKIYSVKVLDATGEGMASDLICGIDWVTSTRTDEDPANDITVANMSLAGPGPALGTCRATTDPEHLAICRSTAAGVTYVAAAGNEGWEFDHAEVPDVPAAYPQVLTVTAMSDGDGEPGGHGQMCSTTASDDSVGGYSNYAVTSAGAAHTIAAPGTCIRSTVRGGGYGPMTGTSMAAPHVAGAVALCVDDGGTSGPCAGLAPAGIIAKLRADAAAQPLGYGFHGDPAHPVPGRYYGHLAWSGVAGTTDPEGPADTTAPAIVDTTPAPGSVGVPVSSPGPRVTVTFNEAMTPSTVQSAFTLTDSSGVAVRGTYSWTGNQMHFQPGTSLAQGTTYTARVAGTAADFSGNTMGVPTEWSFKTVTNVSRTPRSVVVTKGSVRSGTVERLRAHDYSYLRVDSSARSRHAAAWYGQFDGVDNSLRNLGVTYKGMASRRCHQALSLYRWETGTWDPVATGRVGPSPTLVQRRDVPDPAAYVSGTEAQGRLRMRVQCEAPERFVIGGDVMTISYGKP